MSVITHFSEHESTNFHMSSNSKLGIALTKKYVFYLSVSILYIAVF